MTAPTSAIDRNIDRNGALTSFSILGTRPRVCFFGHHHARVRTDVGGVPCIGLNIVGRPGNLVAVDMEPRGRDWAILGEWPQAGAELAPVWPKAMPND